MALKVMSFNVRMDTEKDGDNRWDCRKDVVTGIIQGHAPDVFGLQEPHKHQVEHVAAALPGYAWTGKGRVPTLLGLGEEHCEYNPVFWSTAKFEEVDTGTFWLSDLPMVPGTKFAGAAFPRIATYAKLRRIEDGKEFVFVCTHFDHEGEEPRTKAAQLIVDKLGDIAGEAPAIVVGDLNAGSESEAYRILTSRLTDSACAEGCCPADGLLPAGTSTFCGFADDINSVIDFIFVTQGVAVSGFGVCPDKQPNGCCASDHRPIVAEVTLP